MKVQLALHSDFHDRVHFRRVPISRFAQDIFVVLNILFTEGNKVFRELLDLFASDCT